MGAVIHGTLWDIWKERNQRIFKDNKRPVRVVIDSILGEVGSWLMVDKNFKDLSLNSFMMDWVTIISSSPHNDGAIVKRWEPPLEGQLKLNFNGSSFRNPGLAGYGCIARDTKGNVVFAMCRPFGSCGSMEAKMYALQKGLCTLKEKSLFECLIEGDSSTVIKWADGSGVGSSQHHHTVREIRTLVMEMQAVLAQIPRSMNDMADSLAKWEWD